MNKMQPRQINNDEDDLNYPLIVYLIALSVIIYIALQLSLSFNIQILFLILSVIFISLVAGLVGAVGYTILNSIIEFSIKNKSNV
jgi:K+-sensing histidine kinase KdpD